MCLNISRKLMNIPPFSHVIRECDALIASRPLLVKKHLCLVGDGVEAKTPYRNMLIKFGKRYDCFDQEFDIQNSLSYSSIQGGGYHCLMNNANAQNTGWVGLHDTLYPAIIPANTPFFIGQEKDIVAKSIIVYRTMNDLIAVHGKPEIKGVKPVINYTNKA